MTNTTPSLPSDITYVDVPMEQLIVEAGAVGSEHGKSAASWMEIGSESGARRLLHLDETGDPVLDEYGPTYPLVPEAVAYSDDMTEKRLIEDELELDPDSVTEAERLAIVDAYVFAHRQAYFDDVLGRARSFVAECDRERESEALAEG